MLVSIGTGIQGLLWTYNRGLLSTRFDPQLLIENQQTPQPAAQLNTQLAGPPIDGATYFHYLVSYIKCRCIESLFIQRSGIEQGIDLLRQMFPHHDDNIGIYNFAHQNGSYRTYIIAKSADGETEHHLLVSSPCATVESALEDMTYLQQQRFYSVRHSQPYGKQEWLRMVRENWQATQQLNNFGGSSAFTGA